MNPKEIREQMAKLAAQIRSMADAIAKENREFTAEEQTNWDKLNADYDGLQRKLQIAERTEAIETQQRSMRPADETIGREPVDGRTDPHAAEHRRAADPPSDETRSLALRGWCRAQMGADLTAEEEAACRAVRLRPDARELRFDLLDTRQVRQLQEAASSCHPSQLRRALSTIEMDAGASLVPTEGLMALETAMLQFGGLLQVCEQIRTERGGELPWPTMNDTGNKGRRIAESAAVTSKDPTTGKTILNAYKYTSDEVLVPYELLEDSAFDIAATLMLMLGERLGRIINEECTTGTGNAMPYGIVPASTVGVTTASASKITLDEIIDLIHSVDPAYRVGSRFMLADLTIAHLRKLKDGEGRPLWQSGAREGVPDSLYGYPLTVNQDVPVIAASARTIVFGDLTKYKVRAVRGVRLYRLQEVHRENDQDGFLAFVRRDGNLIDAGTHPVKCLAMHS